MNYDDWHIISFLISKCLLLCQLSFTSSWLLQSLHSLAFCFKGFLFPQMGPLTRDSTGYYPLVWLTWRFNRFQLWHQQEPITPNPVSLTHVTPHLLGVLSSLQCSSLSMDTAHTSLAINSFTKQCSLSFVSSNGVEISGCGSRYTHCYEDVVDSVSYAGMRIHTHTHRWVCLYIYLAASFMWEICNHKLTLVPLINSGSHDRAHFPFPQT